MNRLTGSQKSSRTRSRHSTRRPSHWRIACTQFRGFDLRRGGVQPLLELIEHDHNFSARPSALPFPQGRDGLPEAQVGGQVGSSPFRSPASSRVSVSPAVAST